MGKIADPLRDFARTTTDETEILAVFDGIADAIDAEHERRMEQCRHETRRSFGRYLRSVIWDYLRGVKRKPARRARRISVTTDGLTGYSRCAWCDSSVRPRDLYCWHCGTRLED